MLFRSQVQVTEQQGVIILGIAKDSPASKANLQPGDIFKKIDGKPIETSTDVQSKVEASQIGQPLTIEILREGNLISLELRPAEFPKDEN